MRPTVAHVWGFRVLALPFLALPIPHKDAEQGSSILWLALFASRILTAVNEREIPAVVYGEIQQRC
jgi:hypothetical protein